jgi:hypothetical protein
MYCSYSTMVMHELFSLQIDIDALNPRSSLILYSQGSAVSEFRVLKTYHIHFLSHLSFAAHFHFPWLIFQIVLFGTRLGQHLCCSLPIISIIRGIVGIVAGANSRTVWEASFTPSCFCPPPHKSIYLPAVHHPCDTSGLHSSCHQHRLGVVGIVTGRNYHPI